jgi:hypothetical protein
MQFTANMKCCRISLNNAFKHYSESLLLQDCSVAHAMGVVLVFNTRTAQGHEQAFESRCGQLHECC